MKMQTFRKPHQWLSFWLEKYVEVLTGLKYDGEKRKKYWAVLKVFLEELPGNPRNLAISAVKDFIAADPAERLQPISIFYQNIAPSRPHLEMLRKFDTSEPLVPAESKCSGLVEQFEEVLQKQQLGERTIKNYLTAVSGYLKWMEEKGNCTHDEKVDEYCTFLTTIKQLAPRTVSMYHSAIRLFYSSVTSNTSFSKKQ